MPAAKSSFLDKVLGRIGRLDKEGLQTIVQRLARERSFLETLFNTIEDGVLVADKTGGLRITRHELEVAFPRPRFISLYAAPLDGEAVGSSGVAMILHDATEARQKAHDAIESERIQALTLLAASVAHEIGNPLNALHIHLQLMERELKKLNRAAGGWQI